MNWLPWGATLPEDGELFVGCWDEHGKYICRYVDLGYRQEVRLHDGPMGIGPFTRAPQFWLKLPPDPAKGLG